MANVAILGAPPGHSGKAIVEFGQALAREYGITGDGNEETVLCAAATRLMPGLTARQAFLFGDILFADLSLDERLQHVRSLAGDAQPEASR